MQPAGVIYINDTTRCVIDLYTDTDENMRKGKQRCYFKKKQTINKYIYRVEITMYIYIAYRNSFRKHHSTDVLLRHGSPVYT